MNKATPKNEEKATGTAIAEKPQGTALQSVDFGEDAGAGVQDVSSAELKIPFLTQLQPLSPQVQPVSAGGIPGAVAGMLINGATGELYDIDTKPMPFIPVFRDHKFLEFTPRNLGGGFVAMYEPDDALIMKLRGEQSKFGKLVRNNTKGRNDKGELLDGTEIMESFSLFGLFQDPDSEVWFRGILPFKSTQIKKYQGFMGRVTSIKYANPKNTDENPLPPVTPPMWAHLWSIKSTFESNAKGKFYGVSLTLAAKKADNSEEQPFKSLIPRTDPRYLEAKSFYTMLQEGKAQADYATDKGEQAGGDKRAADETPM